MFCQIPRHDRINFLMAGPAVFRNNILTIRNDKRHVRLMAFAAACLVHDIRVGKVAVLAKGDLAMEIMAGRARQFRMDTGI